jgi:hypothetical protein
MNNVHRIIWHYILGASDLKIEFLSKETLLPIQPRGTEDIEMLFPIRENDPAGFYTLFGIAFGENNEPITENGKLVYKKITINYSPDREDITVVFPSEIKNKKPLRLNHQIDIKISLKEIKWATKLIVERYIDNVLAKEDEIDLEKRVKNTSAKNKKIEYIHSDITSEGGTWRYEIGLEGKDGEAIPPAIISPEFTVFDSEDRPRVLIQNPKTKIAVKFNQLKTTPFKIETKKGISQNLYLSLLFSQGNYTTQAKLIKLKNSKAEEEDTLFLENLQLDNLVDGAAEVHAKLYTGKNERSLEPLKYKGLEVEHGITLFITETPTDEDEKEKQPKEILPTVSVTGPGKITISEKIIPNKILAKVNNLPENLDVVSYRWLLGDKFIDQTSIPELIYPKHASEYPKAGTHNLSVYLLNKNGKELVDQKNKKIFGELKILFEEEIKKSQIKILEPSEKSGKQSNLIHFKAKLNYGGPLEWFKHKKEKHEIVWKITELSNSKNIYSETPLFQGLEDHLDLSSFKSDKYIVLVEIINPKTGEVIAEDQTTLDLTNRPHLVINSSQTINKQDETAILTATLIGETTEMLIKEYVWTIGKELLISKEKKLTLTKETLDKLPIGKIQIEVDTEDMDGHLINGIEKGVKEILVVGEPLKETKPTDRLEIIGKREVKRNEEYGSLYQAKLMGTKSFSAIKKYEWMLNDKRIITKEPALEISRSTIQKLTPQEHKLTVEALNDKEEKIEGIAKGIISFTILENTEPTRVEKFEILLSENEISPSTLIKEGIEINLYGTNLTGKSIRTAILNPITKEMIDFGYWISDQEIIQGEKLIIKINKASIEKAQGLEGNYEIHAGLFEQGKRETIKDEDGKQIRDFVKVKIRKETREEILLKIEVEEDKIDLSATETKLTVVATTGNQDLITKYIWYLESQPIGETDTPELKFRPTPEQKKDLDMQGKKILEVYTSNEKGEPMYNPNNDPIKAIKEINIILSGLPAIDKGYPSKLDTPLIRDFSLSITRPPVGTKFYWEDLSKNKVVITANQSIFKYLGKDKEINVTLQVGDKIYSHEKGNTKVIDNMQTFSFRSEDLEEIKDYTGPVRIIATLVTSDNKQVYDEKTRGPIKVYKEITLLPTEKDSQAYELEIIGPDEFDLNQEEPLILSAKIKKGDESKIGQYVWAVEGVTVSRTLAPRTRLTHADLRNVRTDIITAGFYLTDKAGNSLSDSENKIFAVGKKIKIKQKKPILKLISLKNEKEEVIIKDLNGGFLINAKNPPYKSKIRIVIIGPDDQTYNYCFHDLSEGEYLYTPNLAEGSELNGQEGELRVIALITDEKGEEIKDPKGNTIDSSLTLKLKRTPEEEPLASNFLKGLARGRKKKPRSPQDIFPAEETKPFLELISQDKETFIREEEELKNLKFKVRLRNANKYKGKKLIFRAELKEANEPNVNHAYFFGKWIGVGDPENIEQEVTLHFLKSKTQSSRPPMGRYNISILLEDQATGQTLKEPKFMSDENTIITVLPSLKEGIAITYLEKLPEKVVSQTIKENPPEINIEDNELLSHLLGLARRIKIYAGLYSRKEEKVIGPIWEKTIPEKGYAKLLPVGSFNEEIPEGEYRIIYRAVDPLNSYKKGKLNINGEGAYLGQRITVKS